MKTNYSFECGRKQELLDKLSLELADILEKPIQAVMLMLSEETMYMNHSEDTVFFAEFRYVKTFSSDTEKAAFLEEFADRMLKLIRFYTGVDNHRIYMQFTEMPRDGAWKYTEKKQ